MFKVKISYNFSKEIFFLQIEFMLGVLVIHLFFFKCQYKFT